MAHCLDENCRHFDLKQIGFSCKIPFRQKCNFLFPNQYDLSDSTSSTFPIIPIIFQKSIDYYSKMHIGLIHAEC